MNSSKRVLIVEDELLIAMDLEAELSDRGFEVVGPAGNVDDALRMLDQEEFSIALLDVNLGGRDSMPIASRLQARNVPMIFVSGYNGAMAPAALKGRRIVGKPIDYGELFRAMEEELAAVAREAAD